MVLLTFTVLSGKHNTKPLSRADLELARWTKMTQLYVLYVSRCIAVCWRGRTFTRLFDFRRMGQACL